jgi:hypothetical protein
MLRATAIRELTVDAPRGPNRGHFIAAGSGLVRTGEHLYVIADDEREIAVFPAEGDEPGRLRRLLPGELPADPKERKRVKPDFEALVLLPSQDDHGGAALLAFESGSRESRRGGVIWGLDENGALAGDPRRLDLAPLYSALDIPDLNIEGAAVAGERLLMFQRGNGRAAVNAVIALSLERAMPDLARGRLSADAVVAERRYDLGDIDGVRLAFTDAAALPDGRIVYTAVAEGGDDTYHDGNCAGAGVGVLGADGEQQRWEALDPPAKVEGVEARIDGDAIELLMVADADDPGSPSPLLAARLA